MDQGNSQSAATGARRVPWPWLVIFRPRAAAVALAALSRPAFVAVFGLGLVVYAGVLVFLMLWEGTVTETWNPGPMTTLPASVPASGPAWPVGATEIHECSIMDVWAEWRETAIDGWFGPAEITLVLVIVLGPVLVGLLAWLNLPFVHGSGSVWLSYKRSSRVTAGLLWLLTILTLASGGVFIVSEHAQYRGRTASGLLSDPAFPLFASISIAAWLIVLWLRGAVRGVELAAADGELPLRCEGCGYDLTHQPAEGRCSECGMALVASLDQRLSRPGSLWTRRISMLSWLATTRQVLLHPREFYRRLALRTPLTAERGFAEVHFAAVACGAAVWTGFTISMAAFLHGWSAFTGVEDIAMIGVLVLLGTFGCWFGHRVIAAIVVSWWLARHALPDYRWAAKVVTYETSFLWAFCCFWGLLITSAALGGNWISALLGYGGWNPLGEMFALMGGTVVLTVLWIWRYEVAYRAIRWSNF